MEKDPVIKYKAVTRKGIELVKKQLRIGFFGFACKWVFNATSVLILISAIDHTIRQDNDPRIFILYAAMLGGATIGQAVSVFKLREHFAAMDLEHDFQKVEPHE